MTINVGILETGVPSQETIQRHGNFPAMFRHYFRSAPNLAFTDFAISSGATFPDPHSLDAWLITGSPAGVYESHSWIPPLENFIRNAYALKRPILGICFGHQAMIQALGGKVEKSDRGRGVGIHRYDVTPEGKNIFAGLDELRIVAAHQDQAVSLPPDTRVLAQSAFCPYAALAYGDRGLSLQPHPEFTVPIGLEITKEWQDEDPIDMETFQSAEDTLRTVSPNADAIVPIFASFLSGSHIGA